ncbi:peptidase [Candidatus Saccharibacteria bacterium]|nr:peptidase [Candidatus Saccharibacteria bacterium]
MRKHQWVVIGFLLSVIIVMNCQEKKPVIISYADIPHVENQLGKFVPVEINYNEDLLSENQKKVVLKLVEASKLMDEIFLRQVYKNNVAIREALQRGDNLDYDVLQDYFEINFGPFDRLEGDEPFINLKQEKPEGANYYPVDMTREDFERWIENHPDDKESFTSNFTVIRREDNGLGAIPYSEEYSFFLQQASQLLKEAAELAENPSLKTYLNSRAEAFLSNDYFQSDMNWMDLKDHTIEVVIGPYEVYEDKLFGYKAAFESFITLVDPDESEKLRKVGNYLDALERRLPIPDGHKNFERGKSSPIVVVDEVFTGGDTKAGVQTIAFNLPNDERVREAKGSKKVMLKNVSRAKFEKISTPIMQKVLKKEEVEKVSFDAFFNHVLLHEMSHGIGPGKITKNGKETTVNQELKETYSTLEEAKADVLGLYNFHFMIDQNVFPQEVAESVYPSFVGGIFRSVRFGIEEAHGGGNAIILNYLMEKGAVEFDDDTERFGINYQKIEKAVRDLAHEILMIQALGDYEGAKSFIETYRYESPELQTALDKLEDVPVDIRPIYAIEKELE